MFHASYSWHFSLSLSLSRCDPRMLCFLLLDWKEWELRNRVVRASPCQALHSPLKSTWKGHPLHLECLILFPKSFFTWDLHMKRVMKSCHSCKKIGLCVEKKGNFFEGKIVLSHRVEGMWLRIDHPFHLLHHLLVQLHHQFSSEMYTYYKEADCLMSFNDLMMQRNILLLRSNWCLLISVDINNSLVFLSSCRDFVHYVGVRGISLLYDVRIIARSAFERRTYRIRYYHKEY